jgi:hypothetical protein
MTTAEFKSVVGYIRDRLLKEAKERIYVDNTTIIGITEWLSFEDYLKDTNQKKTRSKAVIEDNEDFNAFWSAFPANDTFTWRGMKFGGVRTLRANK